MPARIQDDEDEAVVSINSVNSYSAYEEKVTLQVGA
jgi:hypothetical protein